MERQWNRARNELNLPQYSFRPISREASIVHIFYEFSNGIALYNISNSPISYAKVWKAGNEAIRGNLYGQEVKEVQPTRPFPAHEFMKESDYRKRLRLDYHIDRSDIFTFVRDPISHFEAGLAEYYFRCFRSMTVSPDVIKEQLMKMLKFQALSVHADSCSRLLLYSVKHIYTMAGIIAAGWSIKYIGKLEQFDRDWVAINDHYNMNITFNHKLGVHQTSQDPQKVRSAFRSVITSPENSKYLRALCHLLLIDFVCFDYQLPEPCRDITF